MNHPLAGKTALVTGASRGIGRSIAVALGAIGARVAVNHRAGKQEAHEVAETIRAHRGQAITVRADITQPEEVETMVRTVSETFGAVDVVVHNAGIARPLPLEALHLATWDATFAVNLRAAFVVTSVVLPGMRARKWGRLLFVSSTAARVGGIVGPHYAASKAGLEGLMHSYASLLAREGITSNAIAPALIETAMLAGNPAATPEKIPVGRFGSPDEVADLAVSLLANPFVTGQTVQINGGVYMT